ncbi:MAG: hypothetical protein JWN03_5931 [Nocardia sp.]|uniref:hypothetical protein n=1 Tax=Nocardia sp. TaxID=1821 RepID=UPI002613A1F1|nr:hypothetical protein [Nocardia sp.]MCU1645656.1 hypothetical protein [Nocardia sp.]
MTAGLLGFAAVLFVVASFLTLMTFESGGQPTIDLPSYTSQWRPWEFHNSVQLSPGPQSPGQVLGIGFVLAAVVAIVAAGLLLAGLGRRSRRVRGLGAAAAGLAVGVSLTLTFDIGTQLMVVGDDTHATLGPGYWALIVTLLVSVGALTSSFTALAASPSAHEPQLDPFGRPRKPRPSGLDVTAGLLSKLFSVLLMAGSFFKLLSGFDMTTWWISDDTQLQGVPLVISAVTAVIAAIVLFTGQARLGRPLASVGAALGFASGGMLVLDVVDQQILNNTVTLGGFGAGFWLLVAGGLVALVVLVLTVLATSTGPRTGAPYGAAPQPMPQGGYLPGVPQQAGFTPPPGGFAPGGPPQGGAPPQSWGVPQQPSQGDYAPGVPPQGGFAPGGPPQGWGVPGSPQHGWSAPPQQQGWSTPPPQGPATEDRR